MSVKLIEYPSAMAISKRGADYESRLICIGEGGGGGGITARLRFKAPWLENCVRRDCDISHSE